MIRSLIAATAFALAFAPAALAQDATAPKFSSKTSTIGAILDNPAAKAAFEKVMPEVAAAPQLQDARDFTIEMVKGMAPEYFPEEKVVELDAELAKIQ